MKKQKKLGNIRKIEMFFFIIILQLPTISDVDFGLDAVIDIVDA